MYAEILYETGRMSVGQYENEDELKDAVRAHHERALNGEAGGPVGAPAERVAAVYVYDQHPNEFNPAQTASGDVLQKELSEMVKRAADENGVVSIDQLALEVRGLSHPMVADAEREGRFASTYKMKESKKLDLAFLEGGN